MKLSKQFNFEFSFLDLTHKTLRTPLIRVKWNLDSDIEMSDESLAKIKQEISSQKVSKGKVAFEFGVLTFDKTAYDNWNKQRVAEGRERLNNIQLDSLVFTENEIRAFYATKKAPKISD